MTPREIVAQFFEWNYRQIFWEQNGDTKGPKEPGWPQRVFTLDDYHEGYRVGILMGVEVEPGKFLHDLDIDWGPGACIATKLLPDTDFIFGRASKKVSHCFYLLPEALPSYRYEDIDGTCLLELRGTKKDGTIGLQTMVPPSIWTKDGKAEPLVFLKDGKPTFYANVSVVKGRIVLTAIGMLLAKHLGHNGFGHDVQLAFAGCLLRLGIPVEELILLGEAVGVACNHVGGTPVRTTVLSTAERLNDPKQKIKGGPALAKLLGENGTQIVTRIHEWLGITDALVLDPNDPLPSARAFVAARHTVDDILTLRRQASVFYEYQTAVAAYHERADDSVRADLYTFLERAKTQGEDGLLSFRPTKAKVSNVADALYAVTNLDPAMAAPRWLANDPGLDPLDILACPNGLLHIPTRTLLPASPHFFTLNGLDFIYNADTPPPTQWLAFLDQLWPDDYESICALQEFFGYVLTPDTRFQKIGLLIGPKRSGKGVTGRILRRLVGDRNTCSPTLASFGDQFGKQVLIGKTLALISDARIGGRIDTASVAETLLGISGEDPQTVQRKFLPDWNGKLSSRFLLLANELPRIGDVSGALASRFVILVLKRSFYGHEDLGLYDRLVTELPSILNWALEGRDRLYARGWFVQPQSAQELIEELADLSSPEAAMLRECTERRIGAWVEQSRLFKAWRVWCADNGRDHSGTTQTFARSVRTALPWVTVKRHGPKGEQERCWEGLYLTEGWMKKLAAPAKDAAEM
jgi:putative DNA primase/helicase